MNNPFDTFDARLSNIESLLLDLKHSPKDVIPLEQSEKLLTIQDASKFLMLSVPTLYSKTSKGELPVMKRNGRLYFSSTELMQYVKDGRKKSNKEIEAEADTYLLNSKKGLK
jgi:excisionase family DNA binding protein